MIVLHAAFLADRLVLWGEVPPDPSAPPPRRRAGVKAKMPKRSGPERLPFDAEAAGLIEALREAVPGIAADTEDVEPWVAWLPTVGGQPVASSPLVAEPPANGSRAELAPWT